MSSLERTVYNLFWDRRDDLPAVHSHCALLRIMRYGSWEDVLVMESEVSRNRLQAALSMALPGDLDRKSHNFWKLRLNSPVSYPAYDDRPLFRPFA